MNLKKRPQLHEIRGEINKVSRDLQHLKEKKEKDQYQHEDRARAQSSSSPVRRVNLSREREHADSEKLTRMEAEINFWREKSELLSSKFFQALQNVRAESSSIKEEMRKQLEFMQRETAEQLHGFLGIYKNVTECILFLMIYTLYRTWLRWTPNFDHCRRNIANIWQHQDPKLRMKES